MDDNKYSTTLRLYKNNPTHFQALTCLETYNRELFGSINDYIAEALIYYSEHLKKTADFEELTGTLSTIKEHENYFKDLTRQALQEVLETVQSISIPSGAEEHTIEEVHQEPEETTGSPVDNTGQATEQDLRLYEYYSSFEDFDEDEGGN
ncbi:hypothetical protein [[Clostridium] symbiosum]|uniref:hypothetical protein n=1 Tax=Clostridium symbiosum TaxID=1512 RepID=UPI001AA12A3A|nr:hypothetical protein [[Clostridium] symbiosum]MBO1695246.1 hypothetical protein [[Clostridium] symbiosum]